MELVNENFLKQRRVEERVKEDRTSRFRKVLTLLLTIFFTFSVINAVLIYNFFNILNKM